MSLKCDFVLNIDITGLEHCKSAPLRFDSKSSLYRGYDLIFSRSKTEKKELPKYELDRLSSTEKVCIKKFKITLFCFVFIF